MVYAFHSWKLEVVKSFWNKLFHWVTSMPQNEMVMLACDINRHVGSCNVSYDGTHCGYEYGVRNADGCSILEFANADRLNLVICNTLFMKQEYKLVTYVWLTILLYGRGTMLRFVTSRSFQMKNLCQGINC